MSGGLPVFALCQVTRLNSSMDEALDGTDDIVWGTMQGEVLPTQR